MLKKTMHLATSFFLGLLLCHHVAAAPVLTISTTTTSRHFDLSDAKALVVALSKDNYQLTITDVAGECGVAAEQKVKFNHPYYLNCQKPTQLNLNIRFSGDYAFVYDKQQHSLTFRRQAKKASEQAYKRPLPEVECLTYDGAARTIKLADTFADGTVLREALSGQQVTVKDGRVTLAAASGSQGLLLLEPVTPKAHDFSYRGANIYFVMLDRFYNGNRANDHAYGRQSDHGDNIGTFHGGDLQGVIAKLDYIKSLGSDVIWLSPIVEQVHGFVGGGSAGSFPFYAYHGYWARDFTKIDANWGSEADLRELVTKAHQLGLKVFLDVVLNHPGYATLADLQRDGIAVVNSSALPARWSDWQPDAGQNWHSYNQLIDYKSKAWSQWWGGDWVRAGLPGYPAPGSSDISMTLAGLPDFRTESQQVVRPPQWLLNNPGTRVRAVPDYRVSDYLIDWQTSWVERFGIDGFRVDTVKHVEGEVWQRLKQQAQQKLHAWRQQNNRTGMPFWMIGEVWGHGPQRSPYSDDGFDALINFDMQKTLDKGAACFSEMANTYQSYAAEMARHSDFTPVSYMSSHDTELFFSRFRNYQMQRNAAAALLLSPGSIQVYYGDEVGRDMGPYADDFHQGTRSDMPWQLSESQQQLLAYWRELALFRQRHPAIGSGTHRVIAQPNAYVFARKLKEDKVVIAFLGRSAGVAQSQ